MVSEFFRAGRPQATSYKRAFLLFVPSSEAAFRFLGAGKRDSLG